MISSPTIVGKLRDVFLTPGTFKLPSGFILNDLVLSRWIDFVSGSLIGLCRLTRVLYKRAYEFNFFGVRTIVSRKESSIYMSLEIAELRIAKLKLCGNIQSNLVSCAQLFSMDVMKTRTLFSKTYLVSSRDNGVIASLSDVERLAFTMRSDQLGSFPLAVEDFHQLCHH